MQYYNFFRIVYIVTLCLTVIISVFLMIIAFKVYPPFRELHNKLEDIKKEAHPTLEEYKRLENLKNDGKEYDESRYKELLEKLLFYQNEIIDCNKMVEGKKNLIKYASGCIVAFVLMGTIFIMLFK